MESNQIYGETPQPWKNLKQEFEKENIPGMCRKIRSDMAATIRGCGLFRVINKMVGCQTS